MSYFEVGRWEDAVYVRVHGLANMNNSHLFKDLTESLLKVSAHLFFVDLGPCTGMDSTFMGVLVGIKLFGERTSDNGEPTRVMVINANGHNHKLLMGLGLQDIIEIRMDPVTLPAGVQLERLEERQFNPVKRIRMIQEAHANLVRLNESNAQVFGPFLKTLAEELADNG